MHSLYDALLTQHARQLTPVRCAQSTIAQLHRYFEDVVLENNLSALVIESLPLASKRLAREKARVRDLARSDRHTFFFVRPSDALNEFARGIGSGTMNTPVMLPVAEHNQVNEHFVIIADARFSALLATVRNSANESSDGDDVIWTFEPDVVYSALEYLMARVTAEQPYHASAFGNAVRTSMPKATSLQLTLSVTTKLAHLLQEQASREIAVNRIATAIHESLELGVILQTTVDEVGRALNVDCGLRVEGQTADQALSYFYFTENASGQSRDEAAAELEMHSACLAQRRELFVRDGCEESDASEERRAVAAAPLVFHERFMGVLQVTAGDPARAWQENELLLMRTVANQVTVAINHADLFAQIRQQALTDPLTGCFNRRSFDMQLDKELQTARRAHQPLSLIMVDLDRFKQLNDSSGHDAGDAALCKLAQCFKEELRAVDSAARFGGDEFALILPEAYSKSAQIVAELLRQRIEQITIGEFGNLTASIGIATFPADGASRLDLIAAADAALYSAKRAGRNRVCVAESSKARIVSSSDDAASFESVM
jgi:diguanylate cyclase (GGDEF)-like protein